MCDKFHKIKIRISGIRCRGKRKLQNFILAQAICDICTTSKHWTHSITVTVGLHKTQPLSFSSFLPTLSGTCKMSVVGSRVHKMAERTEDVVRQWFPNTGKKTRNIVTYVEYKRKRKCEKGCLFRIDLLYSVCALRANGSSSARKHIYTFWEHA